MLGVRSTQLQEVGGVQLGWKSTSDAARRWAPPMPKAGATDGNDPRAGGFAPGSLFTGVRGMGILGTSHTDMRDLMHRTSLNPLIPPPRCPKPSSGAPGLIGAGDCA